MTSLCTYVAWRIDTPPRGQPGGVIDMIDTIDMIDMIDIID